MRRREARGRSLARFADAHGLWTRTATLTSDDCASFRVKDLCRQWSERLSEKQKEFEEVSSTLMNPRELQVMELRLREEVEAPHRAKAAALEREAETLHEQLHAARHDLAVERARAEAEGAAHEKLLTMLKVDYEGRLGEMREHVEALQDAPGQVETLEGQITELRRECAAMRAARGKADEECDVLREQLDRAAPDMEARAMAAKADVQRAQAEESTMRRQLEAVGRRARHLQGELDIAQRTNADLQQLRLAEQAGWASTRAKLEESVSALEGRSYALQESNAHLTAQLSDAEARLDAAASAERVSRKAQEGAHRADLEAARRTAESADEAAKAKLESERARWDARNLELQAALDAARAQALAADRKVADTADSAAREAESLRRDLTTASAEKRKALQAAERASTAKATAEAERESLRREIVRLQEMLSAAEERAGAAGVRAAEADAARERAEQSAGEAAGQLSEAADRAREAREAGDRYAAETRAAAAKEREAVVSRAEGLVEEARVREKATIKKANARLRQQQATIKALVEAREQMRLQLGQAEAQVRALQQWQATVELGGGIAAAAAGGAAGNALGAVGGGSGGGPHRREGAPSLYDSPSQKLTRTMKQLGERQAAYLNAKASA